MKKTLLFVTYGGGHAHMVYPVVHALRENAACKNGSLNIKVLGLPAARHTLKQHGVENVGFIDYLDPIQDKDALQWGQELAKAHHSPSIGIGLEDSIAYLGLSYKDLVVRFGEEAAAKLFQEKARHAFYPLTIMERIFDEIKPDCVIATSSPRSEAAAIDLATQRGINTVIMTDLFSGWRNYKFKARHVTFLNSYARDCFIADGIIDESLSTLHITGNPAFDRLAALPAAKDTQWIAQHFPQATGKKIVLHADTPAYWHTEKCYSHIRPEDEILNELNACYHAAISAECYYLVRPHPSQRRDIYERWIAGKTHASIAADQSLNDTLVNSDLVIARATTVALEAVLGGKRVLQLDHEFHTDLPLANMAVAWGVTGYNDLAGKISGALADDETYKNIQSNIRTLFPQTKAAEKIAALLLHENGLGN